MVVQGAGCEPHKIMRGALELMRVLAIQKQPGSRGVQGARGCAGADGGDEKAMRALIEKQVCGEYAEFGSCLQREWWDVFARATHESDPFVEFCDTTGAWRPEPADPTALACHLSNEVGLPFGVQVPRLVARHTREVYDSKVGSVSRRGVTVARTILRVGEDCYAVTSVETVPSAVVFISNVDQLQNGDVRSVYRCSVEQHLLKVTAKGGGSEAREMITNVGMMPGASADVNDAIRASGGYTPPPADISNKISEVVANTVCAGTEVTVIGILRRAHELYALVVPCEGGRVCEKPYIVSGIGLALRVTDEGAVHQGAAVVMIREEGEMTVLRVESPRGVRLVGLTVDQYGPRLELARGLLGYPPTEVLREAWLQVDIPVVVAEEQTDIDRKISSLSECLAVIERNKTLKEYVNRYALLGMCFGLLERAEQQRAGGGTVSRSASAPSVTPPLDGEQTFLAGMNQVIKEASKDVGALERDIWGVEDTLDTSRYNFVVELRKVKERLSDIVTGGGNDGGGVTVVTKIEREVCELYHRNEFTAQPEDGQGRVFALPDERDDKPVGLEAAAATLEVVADRKSLCERGLENVQQALARVGEMEKSFYVECGVIRMTEVGYVDDGTVIILAYLPLPYDSVAVNVTRKYMSKADATVSIPLLSGPPGPLFWINETTQMVEAKPDSAFFGDDCYAASVAVVSTINLDDGKSLSAYGRPSVLRQLRGFTHTSGATHQTVGYGYQETDADKFREITYTVDTTDEHKGRNLAFPAQGGFHLYLRVHFQLEAIVIENTSAPRYEFINEESIELDGVRASATNRRRLSKLGMGLTWTRTTNTAAIQFSPDLFYQNHIVNKGGIWPYSNVLINYELALVALTTHAEAADVVDLAKGQLVLTMGAPTPKIRALHALGRYAHRAYEDFGGGLGNQTAVHASRYVREGESEAEWKERHTSYEDLLAALFDDTVPIKTTPPYVQAGRSEAEMKTRYEEYTKFKRMWRSGWYYGSTSAVYGKKFVRPSEYVDNSGVTRPLSPVDALPQEVWDTLVYHDYGYHAQAAADAVHDAAYDYYAALKAGVSLADAPCVYGVFSEYIKGLVGMKRGVEYLLYAKGNIGGLPENRKELTEITKMANCFSDAVWSVSIEGRYAAFVFLAYPEEWKRTFGVDPPVVAGWDPRKNGCTLDQAKEAAKVAADAATPDKLRDVARARIRSARTIGKQLWDSGNLEAPGYIGSKASPVPAAQDYSALVVATTPVALKKGRTRAGRAAWCQGESGRLYNKVADLDRLCHAGWRVPTKDDWDELIAYYEETYNTADTYLDAATKDGFVVGGMWHAQGNEVAELQRESGKFVTRELSDPEKYGGYLVRLICYDPILLSPTSQAS
jgi:hypothetical protein